MDLECQYIVFGREVGEEGTEHLQGYVEFERKKRFSVVKRLLSNRVHLEKSKGNSQENRNYCIKDGNFYEKGDPINQGGEKTSAEVVKLAKEGKFDEIEALDPYKYLQYYRTLQMIYKDNQKKPEPLTGTCGIWIFGMSGVGKSHWARQFDPYLKNLNKWWDGYQGEDCVVIEEVNPDNTAWIAPYLKLWGDKWPFTAEIKGSSRMIRPKRVIITSNYSIQAMGFPVQDAAAIRRRFVEIEKVTRDQAIML